MTIQSRQEVALRPATFSYPTPQHRSSPTTHQMSSWGTSQQISNTPTHRILPYIPAPIQQHPLPHEHPHPAPQRILPYIPAPIQPHPLPYEHPHPATQQQAPEQQPHPAPRQQPQPPPPQQPQPPLQEFYQSWDLEMAHNNAEMLHPTGFMDLLNQTGQLNNEYLGEQCENNFVAASTHLSTSKPSSHNQESGASIKRNAPRPKKERERRHLVTKKILAIPEQKGFEDNPVNKIITEIICGFIGGSKFTTWGSVDGPTQGRMFREFTNRVHIEGGFTQEEVVGALKSKCSARFRQITSALKKKYDDTKTFAFWVLGDLQLALIARWKTDGFKKSSKKTGGVASPLLAAHYTQAAQSHSPKLEGDGKVAL